MLANIGDAAGYWLVFGTLTVLGWFIGIMQGCFYKENAKLPSKYIGIFFVS